MRTYNVNLVPNYGAETIVPVSQYDTGLRWCYIAVYYEDELYDIDEDAIITVRGTKPDLTGFEYELVSGDSGVILPMTDQMTVLSGIVPCELRISLSGQIIGTANFVLDVEPSALDEDVTISETDLPLLEKAERNAIRAEAAADTAERALSSAHFYVFGVEDGILYYERNDNATDLAFTLTDGILEVEIL